MKKLIIQFLTWLGFIKAESTQTKRNRRQRRLDRVPKKEETKKANVKKLSWYKDWHGYKKRQRELYEERLLKRGCKMWHFYHDGYDVRIIALNYKNAIRKFNNYVRRTEAQTA